MSIISFLKDRFSGKVAWPDTSGPAQEPAEATYMHDGFWSGAVAKPAHPGRVGGPIKPKTLVVHTTDMYDAAGERRQFDALLKAWVERNTNGACAHYVIGRTAEQGAIQLVSINRNGNHAGGPTVNGQVRHGWYRLPTGEMVHPNLYAVGIELHSGGLLKYDSKAHSFRHEDTNRLVPDSDVYVDGRGRGWQMVTPFQFSVLAALIPSLQLPGLSAGSVAVPDGDYRANGVEYYAKVTNPKVVIHATLDPVNKTDAGPQVADWLRNKGFME